MNTYVVNAAEGEVLLEALLRDGVAVAHECGGKLACSTCRVVVRAGMEQLSPMSEDELDMLERAQADAPGARGAVAVRLALEPAGCSGLRYRVDPIEALGEADSLFESGGVRIAVDALSLPYLQGSRIDLVQDGLARRLRYDNPNVSQSCGCGESFGV